MFDDFKKWLSHPFSVDMPASHWFLFIGLLVAISASWGLILRMVKETV